MLSLSKHDIEPYVRPIQFIRRSDALRKHFKISQAFKVTLRQAQGDKKPNLRLSSSCPDAVEESKSEKLKNQILCILFTVVNKNWDFCAV